jgi:outer membrane autotransporter protein
MTPSGLTDANRFYTAGLTAGVDMRIHDDVIIGVAVGYGADRTDVGSDGTRSDGTSYTAMAYASLRLYDPLFLDTALGYGTLGFDNRRFVSGDSTIVSGNRKGSYWFGAASLSLELGRDGIKFAPYVGGNYMSAKLDGYNESGTSGELLTFQQSTFSATSAIVGLRGSIDMPTAFGMLTPNARLEYRNTWLSTYDQSMYYTDLGPGVLSTIAQPGTRQGTTTAAVGLRARAPGGLTAELEYGVSEGTGALLAQTLRAQLRLPF